MSEEVWEGWLQSRKAKWSDAGYSDFRHGGNLRSSSKKDGFENFVQVELFIPFVSATIEFEKKSAQV